MVLGKLTAFATTNYWLMQDANGYGFEVCTWLDSRVQRQHSKVVIGPTGADKHAYLDWALDAAVQSAVQNLRTNQDAFDWEARYVGTLADMWHPFNIAHRNGLVYDVPVGAAPSSAPHG